MQTAARDHWREAAEAKYGLGGEEDETPDDEFGWLGPFPETLELCQMALEHKIWPCAGGWFDQPEWFRSDFRTYLRGLARQMRIVKPRANTTGGNGAAAPVALYEIPDWSEMG